MLALCRGISFGRLVRTHLAFLAPRDPLLYSKKLAIFHSLNHFNPVHTFIPYLSKIKSNVTIQSGLGILIPCPGLKFLIHDTICIYYIRCACYAFTNSVFRDSAGVTTLGDLCKLWSSLVCNFLCPHLTVSCCRKFKIIKIYFMSRFHLTPADWFFKVQW